MTVAYQTRDMDRGQVRVGIRIQASLNVSAFMAKQNVTGYVVPYGGGRSNAGSRRGSVLVAGASPVGCATAVSTWSRTPRDVPGGIVIVAGFLFDENMPHRMMRKLLHMREENFP